MSRVAAFLRLSFLTVASYRINLLYNILAIVGTVVPLYFIAGALQPMMADSIAAEGDHYFAFVVLGIIANRYVTQAVSALPNAVYSGIGTGTFEALLATPTRLPVILSGFTIYGFIRVTIQVISTVIIAWAMGAHFVWQQMGSAILILGLLTLSYFPFGLLGAAMVLAFRTSGPLTMVVTTASLLLGGVYYPTQVIPSWIQHISTILPMTYGLRALRGTALEGLSLSEVGRDLGVLAAFVLVASLAGWWAFTSALAYARRSGTLAQY